MRCKDCKCEVRGRCYGRLCEDCWVDRITVMTSRGPAPWFNWSHGAEGDFGLYCGDPEDASEIFDLLERREPVDLEFAALARNALDIMVRRGWGTEAVSTSEHLPIVWRFVATLPKGEPVNGVVYDDPFTALVEAEKWLVERLG